MTTGYIFVIDTDKYAGNFEREMCAYITGIFDDGGVAKEDAKVYAKEMGLEFSSISGVNKNPLEKYIRFVDDRPVNIYPNRRWYCDGTGNHYRRKDPKKYRCYLNKRWPAYASVAIYLEKLPPEKILKFMKDRAEKFVKEYWLGESRSVDMFGKYRESIKIEGFRLIEIVETVSETEL